MMKSYLSLFRNYANFSGYLNRGKYWTAMFVHGLMVLLPLVPGVMYLLNQSGLLPGALDLAVSEGLTVQTYLSWVLPLWFLYGLLMIIPVWSASVRRLHSIPQSGWRLLIGFIPVVGWFILLILLFQKGNYEEYLRRLKRARGENSLHNAVEDTLTAAGKSRGGSWFFVVLILLTAGGWFLNRQIMEHGLKETLLTAFSALNLDGEALWKNLTENPDLTATAGAELALTQTVLAQTPEPTETPLPTVTPLPTQTPEPTLPPEPTEEPGPPVLIREKDNARMVLIPGSSFSMGDAKGAIDERPVHEVTLSGYWMDIYEVNNEQYELCVAAGACEPPHERKSLRHESYFGNPLYNNYPVITVDRTQAAVYCEWTGGRLPTEAEWEYAAKGPEENAYPWGAAFVPGNLNYSGNGDFDTLAVNANPEDVSAFGVYDLGGNVSEWVLDRYQENWYSLTDQPADPTGPSFGQYYAIRGGSAQTGENNARTADRFYALGTSYSFDRGFRCVKPEEE